VFSVNPQTNNNVGEVSAHQYLSPTQHYAAGHQLKKKLYYTIEEVDFCAMKCCPVDCPKAEVK
jgi:hypothetical protein